MSQSNFEPSRNQKKADDLDSILGDLSGLSELIDDTNDPQLGEIPQLGPDDSLLGDLSLLDDDGAAGLDEFPGDDELLAAGEDDIPLLTDSVELELPTQPLYDSSNTVPLLEERVSQGGDAEKDQFLLSELENIASQLSTPLENADEPAEAEAGNEIPPDISLSGAISIDEQEEAMLAELANDPELMGGALLDEAMESESIPADSEFNDSEYLHLVDSLDNSETNGDMQPPPSHAITEAVSEFVSQDRAQSKGSANSFTAELHTQLARQIDSLLVNAINSLSDELNHHLSERMEKLLLGAVDQAMPRLMEQLSQGLRNEVQKQVSTQLPHIVNEMLGKLGGDKE